MEIFLRFTHQLFGLVFSSHEMRTWTKTFDMGLEKKEQTEEIVTE